MTNRLDAFDYSWARPSPQAMADAGIKVVARYLFRDGDGGKGIDPAELHALHAAGIGVVFGYEGNSGNHLLGASQGASDGEAARAAAADLGVPVGTPIYYACDRDVLASQMTTVMEYLHATDSGPYPSRCYAEYDVCNRFGRPAWQTIAWSGGLVSPHAVLYQYAIEQDFHGSAVDYNHIIDGTKLGAWWPKGSEFDMPTAAEVVDEMFDRHIWGADKPTFIQTFRAMSKAINEIDATADKVFARLLETGQAGGLTKADVRAALRAVFADAGTP